MPHNTKFISDIKLPDGITYEIHDKYAIHEPGDLGIHGALIFKGVLTAEDKLPTATANTVGHVYLIGAMEYVCVEVAGTPVSYKWEKLGNVHDAASSTHKHAVTVTGQNGASAVTGTTPVSVATATIETVGGTAAAQKLTTSTDKVLGEATKFNTTVSGNGLGQITKRGLTASTSISGLAVAANGTTNVITGLTPTSDSFITSVTPDTEDVIKSVSTGQASAITGLGTSTTDTFIKSIKPGTGTFLTGLGTASTAKAATALNTLTPAKVSIPNVTSVGSASTWDFVVSTNGVLTITGVNSVAPTLGTALVASRLGDQGTTTVATGIKSTADAITGYTPTSNTAITGLGTPTTAPAITGLGTPTTAKFVNSVTTTGATVINDISTEDANALTGLGTPTTKTVWTQTKISGTPSLATTLSATTEGAGDVDVVTQIAAGALSATTSADNTDLVDAVTSVSSAASAVTLAKNVVTNVTNKNENRNLVNGNAAAQSWKQVSGSTGTPIDQQ